VTSRTDELTIAYAPVTSGFAWRRLGFFFALTLIAVAAFGAAFAVGYARINEGHVVPGVDVAGVSLAGLDRPSAEAQLRHSLPDLSSGSLIVDIGGLREAIAYRDFGRDYNLGYMLDQAFDIGRAPTFVEELQEQVRVLMNGVSVPPVMTWNNDALASRIAELAASGYRTPSDATITRVDGHYVVAPAVVGQSVDAQQAVAMAMAAVNSLSTADTHFSLDATPIAPTVTTEQAQAAADQAEHVVADSVVVSAADRSATITADQLRGWVHLDAAPGGGSWQLTIERGPVDQWVQNLGIAFNTQPTNASFGFTDGIVQVVASSIGSAVDVETTTNNVMAALQERVAGGTSTTAALAMAPVLPEFSTAQAQALASRVKLLSTWTTHFIPGALNGNGINIQIPTSIINGMVVNPGQEFDYLNAIGPITSPPYETGGALIHGQIVEDGAVGGGMCSCSTTLFNAAVRYGLEITHRSNHSIYISRYPLGLDATIWQAGPTSRQTMAFINDTAYPVLIKGINSRGKVTFEIWGVDDGRTVSFSEPDVQNLNPGVKMYEYVDTLAPGVKKFVNDPYDAMDVTVVRTVRDAAGNIIHQDSFFSHYKRLDGITEVGRYAGDPPAGTRIPIDQYHGGGPGPTPTPSNSPNPSHSPRPTPEPTPTEAPTPEPTPTDVPSPTA
jgi:vancomycin resistance protein YoaR